MSPALAFLGVSILGTWGLASIGLIAAGIIMLFFPGDPITASDNTLGGLFFALLTLVTGALWPAVLIHAFADLASGELAYRARRGPPADP